jgi:serine/threonine protein kinase
MDLKNLHELGYSHGDFHSGNILQINKGSYISDFGLSGPSNKQKSDGKIYGVLPYIAPEVLNGESYTSSSDIYSFGVIMTELSSGKGTPEIYKRLAYKCMNANSSQRPTAGELCDLLNIWCNCFNYKNHQEEKLDYKGEIKAIFEKANKEIPNISTSLKKDPDAIYTTSRAFTFSSLIKPINSSIITSYLKEENNGGIVLRLKFLNIQSYNYYCFYKSLRFSIN